MSIWLRMPDRVPSRFACDADGPRTVPPGRAAGRAPARRAARTWVTALAARLLAELASARDTRLRRGAATW